jgi:hypothetical protein
MKVLDWAGGLFRWVGGAVVPMFARPVAPVPLAWFAHVLLVLLLLVAAYVAQNRFGWTVSVKYGPGWFKPFWLSAVGLLVYLLLWAAGVLRDLLAPVQPAAEFPDLDDAWAGVVAALEQSAIPLRDTPLYLVLGDLPGGYEPLFRAVPHGLAVGGGNPSGASLQVFANRDAIYLTVPGATLLGAQAAMSVIELVGVSATDSVNLMASIGLGGSIGLTGSVGLGSVGAGGWLGSVGRGGSVGGAGLLAGSIGGSLGAGGPLDEIRRIIQEAKERGRPLTAAEKERMRQLSDETRAKSPTRKPKDGSRSAEAMNVLQNPPLVDEAEARAEHLSALIASARWPACPVNGVLLTIPATALEKDADAQQWGLVARHDLTALERHLRLRVPVFAVVGGVETLPGGGTFFDKFAPDKATRRLGKGFPLNPDVRPEQAAAAVEQAAEFVLGELLPHSAVKLTRVTGNLPADTAENAELVRFYDAARRRGPHLGRLLSRAVGGGDRPAVFGGCYLAVVPGSNPTEAVFVKELFEKVLTTAKCVAWTPAAYARDSAFRMKALAGNAALAVLVLAVLGLAGYVGYLNFGR